MPTYNRRRFVPQAFDCFLRQDYPERELIVVDDGTDPVKDLMPKDPRIRYIVQNKKLTIGSKRNLACEEANGEIVVHWDDDDWHARHRLRYQVMYLTRRQADICGSNKLLYYSLVTKELWLYEFPLIEKIWLAGGSLCYTKSFWQENPFDDTNHGEDTRFVWKKRLKNAVILPDFKFYVATIHPGNTSPKSLSSSCWKRWPDDDLQGIMGDDWQFYSKYGCFKSGHG
jgi:glycosyltransferase involved in cell wall biosynthesis